MHAFTYQPSTAAAAAAERRAGILQWCNLPMQQNKRNESEIVSFLEEKEEKREKRGRERRRRRRRKKKKRIGGREVPTYSY